MTKSSRQHDLHAVRVDRHRRRRLDHLLDRLHAGPHAREAAHREGVQPHVEDVLHVGREEHRQPAGLEDVVALVRRGAALGHVVVARDRDHAAVACAVPAMLACLKTSEQRSTPGPLPYQMPNTPSNFFDCRVQVELLRAPHRGGAEFFVDARLEHDVLFGQVLLRRPQRLVVAAERRAAVAADEAGRVQPGDARRACAAASAGAPAPARRS